MPEPQSASNTPESDPQPPGDVAAPEAASTAPEPVENASGAEDFKPAGGELVAIDPGDAYRAMDRADEEQILDELMGRALEAMVYSFEQGGKKVTDLSYGGVHEAVRTLNVRGLTEIRVSNVPPVVDEITEDGGSYYRVLAYAEDRKNGGGQWGTAVVPKRMKLKAGTAAAWRKKGREVRDDDTVWDQFALTKALSKAQRNAQKPMLPLEYVQALVAQYLGQPAKVRHIRSSTAEKLEELPPPLTDERAEGQKAEARDIYDQIKQAAGRAWFPAAEFNAYLARAEHDHDRLDDFLEFLRSKLEQAQAEPVAT